MDTMVSNELQAERPGTQAGDAVLVRVADVARRPVGWLWPGRVPSGKLTLVAGDPGLGKSLLALDIAARVTRGLPWPDGEEVERGSVERESVKSGAQDAGNAPPAGASDHADSEAAGQASRGTPEWPSGSGAGAASPSASSLSLSRSCCPVGSVILLSAEDDVADTIRPRLEAAGADVERVVVLEAVRRTGGGSVGAEAFSLASDLDALDQAIERTGDVRLVIIDPLTAYLGRQGSSEPRGLLTALKRLAQRRGVAIVGVTHLNKSAGKSALYRATGCLAFVAAARAVWAVASDPGRPGRHLLLPVKCNLAGRVAGLAFTIQDSPERPGAPVLAWERGPVLVGADEALATAGREAATEREQAAAWLRELLAAGPVPVSQVRRKALDAGFSWVTVKRAKAVAAVEHYSTGRRAAWEWRLAGACAPPDSNVDHPVEVIHIRKGDPHLDSPPSDGTAAGNPGGEPASGAKMT